VNFLNVLLKIGICTKSFITNLALHGFNFQMETVDVILEVGLWCKQFVAILTFECFIVIMNSTDVDFKAPFSTECLAAKFTLTWLQVFFHLLVFS
jgi:uncharacterized membrane protein YqaE (UPF0057 family)